MGYFIATDKTEILVIQHPHPTLDGESEISTDEQGIEVSELDIMCVTSVAASEFDLRKKRNTSVGSYSISAV